MTEDLIWIFIHLSKTGGTTFKGHLYRHLDWDESFIELSNWGRTYRQEAQRLPFAERSAEQRNRALVLSGHQAYYGIHRLVPSKKPRYITLVRNPADRCVSMYNFRRSRGTIKVDFHTWYKQTYKVFHQNFMVHFFAECLVHQKLPMNHEQNFKLAKKLLTLCWYVGITEQLDNDLTYLFKEMGLPMSWKNYRVAGQPDSALVNLSHPKEGEVIHQYFTLDSDTRKQIYKDSPMDLQLYRWVLNKKQAVSTAGAFH